MRTFYAAVALVALLVTPVFAGSSADGILAANKAASGGAVWDGKQSLSATYAFEGQGLKGTIDSLTDLVNPRFVDRFDAGVLKQNYGFDGSRAWTQDTSGQVTYQDGGDQREIAVNEAYRRGNLMWRADHGGAQISAPAQKNDGGRSFDVLTITPRDGLPFELWIDAKTHLAGRIVEHQGIVTVTVTYSDYRAVDGVELPFHTVQGTGDAKYDNVTTITRASFGPKAEASAFAAPAVTKVDFELAGGAHETTIPFTLVNNHIYLDVTLNGKGPFRLLVDTGGFNIVTPTLAKELGLKTEGAVEARGAGEGTMEAGFTKIAELKLGGATLHDQVFGVVPIEVMSDVEGVPALGIVGFEIFRRFVAQIDYAGGKLTLIDPKTFNPANAGTAVPFAFDDIIPEIQGDIDGIKGKFMLDTGSRAALILTQPFVETNGLRARYTRGVEAVTGWGVGGVSRGFVTRTHMLTIGTSVRVPAPVTTLGTQTKGAMADKAIAGNIGGGIMKSFVVTFDYGNQKVYFRAPTHPLAADGYDRAGMWINGASDGFKIIDVTAGSPAADAGLKAGDHIIMVDGKLAGEIALPDFRARLRDDPPGTKIKMSVQSGGATHEVTITLRDLI